MESKGRRVPQRPVVAPAATEPFGEPMTRNAAQPAEIAVQPATPAAAAAAAVPDQVLPVETQAVPPAAAPPPPSPVRAEGAIAIARDEPASFGREAFDALAQSQAALARGLEALSAEMAGLTILGIDFAARTATDMLAVKTLSDAIALNAGFARNSFDTMVSGSAKLSELSIKLAADTTLPILAQFGHGWTKATGASGA
jgi:hypothetical protein